MPLMCISEKQLGRAPDQLSAIVGYAGGRAAGPDGKVCYYLADPRVGWVGGWVDGWMVEVGCWVWDQQPAKNMM
jgi:hypothetical protein